MVGVEEVGTITGAPQAGGIAILYLVDLVAKTPLRLTAAQFFVA